MLLLLKFTQQKHIVCMILSYITYKQHYFIKNK